MNKKITSLLLLGAILIGFFFHLFYINKVPPCLNADEVAFSYNAFSIWKKGRDEYGKLLPLRFKSFEDFKLPVYTYLTVPIVAVLGLNDTSTRLLNIIIGISFIPLTFLLAKELFNDKRVAVLSSLFISLSPWIYILSRHAHEGVPGALFALLAFYYLVRYAKTNKLKYFALTCVSSLLTASSYHSGRLFLLFFIAAVIFVALKNFRSHSTKNLILKAVLVVVCVLLPFGIDAYYGANRVTSLFFLNNQGFQLRIDEYLTEHNFRIIHNKVVGGVRDVSNRYFAQISPEFFVIHGDTNLRFGYENMGLITPFEYIGIFIGLYFIFKKKEPFRYLIVFILLLSPLPNAFTWQDMSIIRSYFLIFPIVLLVGYGAFHLFDSLPHKKYILRISIVILGGAYLFFTGLNWDIYFLHYPKRAAVVRAWQCGYKELVRYVQDNYSQYDQFVITRKHGQPYIYFLYFMNYDPARYQSQAKLTGPDGYGFGQVEKFDKFIFNFSFDPTKKRTVFIGYPEEFKDTGIDEKKVKHIRIRTEDIFWIYESK